MDVHRGPGQRIGRLKRLRLPLVVAAAAALAAPTGYAGYAIAQGADSTEPSGSPADWSQAEWIAHDPALDPAAWEDARFVPIDCSSKPYIGEPGQHCWVARDLPPIDHDAPEPWPGRKLWCEDTLSPSLSAKDPTCDAEVIFDRYRPAVKAELEAYRVDVAYGEGTE